MHLGEEKRIAFSFLFSLFLLLILSSPLRRPSTQPQPLAPPYLPLQFPGSSLRRLTASGLSRSAAPFFPWGDTRFFVFFFFPLLDGTTTLFPSSSSLIWVCFWSFGIALWIGLGTVAWFRRMGHCAVRTGAGRLLRLLYCCCCCCWWNLYIWRISFSLCLSLLVNWWLSKSGFENPLSFLESYNTC